jgi:toxin YoeB
VAIIAVGELSGIIETAHLLRSPRNARRLLAALNRAQEKKSSLRPFRNCAARLVLTKKNKPAAQGRKKRDAVFHPEFREDLKYWVRIDRSVAVRAFEIIEAVMRDPFNGIGKPEQLKYLHPGTWSRRLTQEHRIVYVFSDDRIDFPQARYHY